MESPSGLSRSRLYRKVVDPPLPESIEGHVGWGFEQPGTAEGVPAHGSRVRTGLEQG